MTRVPARLLVVAMLSLSIVACSTPYRPQGIAGGYSDVRLDRNVFRITFQGSIATKQGATDEMVLLRAAEVSLQNGYPFFIDSGPAATGSALSVPAGIVSVPSSTLTITCFESRPETSLVVHDAARIVDALAAKYPRP